MIESEETFDLAQARKSWRALPLPMKALLAFVGGALVFAVLASLLG